MQLGYLELGDQNYPAALSAFDAIAKVMPEQASALFGGKAMVHFSMGDLEQARKEAEEARTWATTASDTERAEHILRDLERRAENERIAKQRAEALRNAPPAPMAVVRADAEPAARDEAPLRQYPPPPPETRHIEGTAIAFECSKDGARLRMRAGDRTLVFGFDDPDKVMLRHNGKVVHEFTCGPQKPYKVSLEYDEAPAESGVFGWIRLLEF